MDSGNDSCLFDLRDNSTSASGISRSSDQSSMTLLLFCFDCNFLIEPDKRADLGILSGIGIPALRAEAIASSVPASSLSRSNNCQSSSPVLDSTSERIERREEMESR